MHHHVIKRKEGIVFLVIESGGLKRKLNYCIEREIINVNLSEESIFRIRGSIDQKNQSKEVC